VRARFRWQAPTFHDLVVVAAFYNGLGGELSVSGADQEPGRFSPHPGVEFEPNGNELGAFEVSAFTEERELLGVSLENGAQLLVCLSKCRFVLCDPRYLFLVRLIGVFSSAADLRNRAQVVMCGNNA
jgi:hypothetical protein